VIIIYLCCICILLKAVLGKSSTPATSATATTQKEIIYTQAYDELIEFRKSLASISFDKAQMRLQALKKIREDDVAQANENILAYHLYQHCQGLVSTLIQNGDERPLQIVRYNENGSFIASGSLSPLLKIWNGNTMENVKILRGHTDRITGISWQSEGSGNSSSSSSSSSAKHLLASSSADGSCIVWNYDSLVHNGHSTEMEVEAIHKSSTSSEKMLKQKLTGHNNAAAIVTSCEFHPLMKNIIGTSCNDFTWSLFDIETGQEILLQDGHTKECLSLAFHPDGSLVFTADQGGVGLLWDLRSGQMIQAFQGHVKKVSRSVFHPTNGFQVATSSYDHTVKIWDLRKRKCFYTLPAHSNIISDVRFSPKTGELLLTSSFDGSLKLWNTRDYNFVHQLTTGKEKIYSCDFSSDEKQIVSASHDKNLTLYALRGGF
jgi:U4/U6 small nuclear ribonucleoprotein PRP4